MGCSGDARSASSFAAKAYRCILLGVVLIGGMAACAPPHVRVVIEDPSNIAGETEFLRFELADNDPLDISLEEENPKYPTSITLTAQQEGPGTLFITAFNP